MKRPQFPDYRDYMRWRLDRRVATIAERVASVKKNYIDGLSLTDELAAGSESDRLWLDKFCTPGNGLDIACGDFLHGDPDQASGVDGHERQIGTDHFNEGDELTFAEPGKYCFIVTNYLDAFPNPLKVLNEWYRALSFKDGRVAIVCRDAEYPEKNKHLERGPLSNPKRQSVYTVITLPQYLKRAGFVNVTAEKTKWGSLRVSAVKRGDPGNNCPKCGQDRSNLVK
jgi:SAM-dependent methyltransferase